MASSDSPEDDSQENNDNLVFPRIDPDFEEAAELLLYFNDSHHKKATTFFGSNPPKRPKRDGTKIQQQVKIERVKLFDEAMESIKTRTEKSISIFTGFDLITEKRKAPSLLDLSLKSLANYSDSIKSLYLVPDHLRKKLSDLVSDQGRVDLRFMQILIQDSPVEISVRNCVSVGETDMVQILCDIDSVSLRVLNLGQCGRSMTHGAIFVFLTRCPSGFESLTTLSLQGAFSLTDKALHFISLLATNLRFINLSCCSLLTSRALKILADSFAYTLRGLNIEGCQGIVINSSYDLKKFRGLNYLSVLGLESISVCSVVKFLTSRGSNLTDLSLGSCNDEVIGVIGTYCQKLETLDISGSDNLTDSSLGDIADGCRSLNSIKLTRTRFSDEAIAAFLEVSGGFLTQLCLNNVQDVGRNTAISLAKVCKRLCYLDLSWCRNLTEEELRHILCCCSSLRSLKLFGWTQVDDEFLEELSKSRVHIIGLKMTSVFAHPDDSFPSVDAKYF